ncbi:MAG: hypothetical protein HYY06_25610 [Deltaproteobacteria bacterium]|nr:hypothetical protein [Deltaproteobacteria bacterium]
MSQSAPTAAPEDVDRELAALPAGEQLRIVEVWVAAGDVARVAAAAAGSLADRSARKAARKGVHVLKSRGVVLEVPSRAAPAPARRPSEGASGYLTLVDPEGTQLLLYAYPAPEGGLFVVQAVVQRGKGILDGDGFQLSRKKLRVLVEGIKDKGLRFFEAPADYVRWRLAGHLQRSRDDGRPVPPSIAGTEALLPPVLETPPPHPLDQELPKLYRLPGRVTEAELTALDEIDLLAAWGPEERVIHQLIARLRASAGGGLLYVTEAQSKDAEEEALGRTIEETFGPREVWALDLSDTALCLSRSGARPQAELLARCADELSSADRATRDIAFVRWMYRHHLERHSHHAGPDEEAGPGEEAPPKKTPGGIYIP